MGQSVAVVTGAGRGIGRAICERFAGAGFALVGGSRTVSELEETGEIVRRRKGSFAGLPTDVCEPADLQALVDLAMERFGRVDAWINCAGVAPLCGIDQLDEPLFRMLQSVNIEAVYQSTRVVWPFMVRAGRGVLVNISSVASVDPFPGLTAYGASKAWVNAWTRGLADEGRPHGIRVFSVAPGAVETKMLRDAFPDYPAEQTLKPMDVADVVFALCQDEVRHASGQTVFVRR